MTSIMKTMKIRVDENETDKLSNVKKFGVTTTDVTKRAALGELQNRGVFRAANGKGAALKDDNKVEKGFKVTAKARVDTHWKKTTSIDGITTTNAAAGPTKAGERKILTRSNSVRLGTASLTTAGARNSANTLLAGQNKPTTLITKVIENKVQQVKVISRTNQNVENQTKQTVDTKMRREDSNLSRKSLTKLKAALSRDTAAATTTTTVKPSIRPNSTSSIAPTAIKKETAFVRPIVQSSKSEIKIVSVQTHSTKLLSAVEDIDANDGENLLLVSEYVNDIYDYLYNLETEQTVRADHLGNQEEVFPKMRAVLLDWVNEVHLQFHLTVETYHMAVAIIDRYLQVVQNTKRTHLQLVGVTALFIAAKYEELLPPAIGDFVYITDDSYTAKQILQMELKIFRALDCNLSRPLPIHFLRRYSKAANAEDCHHAMSKYFLELTSVEYDMASYKPSEIAAASLFLSLHLFKDDSKVASGFRNRHWTPTLEWYSRYTADSLRPLAKKIAEIARKAPNEKLTAIYKKYQSSKFQKISNSSQLYSPLMDSIIKTKD